MSVVVSLAAALKCSLTASRSRHPAGSLQKLRKQEMPKLLGLSEDWEATGPNPALRFNSGHTIASSRCSCGAAAGVTAPFPLPFHQHSLRGEAAHWTVTPDVAITTTTPARCLFLSGDESRDNPMQDAGPALRRCPVLAFSPDVETGRSLSHRAESGGPHSGLSVAKPRAVACPLQIALLPDLLNVGDVALEIRFLPLHSACGLLQFTIRPPLRGVRTVVGFCCAGVIACALCLLDTSRVAVQATCLVGPGRLYDDVCRERGAVAPAMEQTFTTIQDCDIYRAERALRHRVFNRRDSQHDSAAGCGMTVPKSSEAHPSSI
jgi:hypothetical protein